MQSIQCREFAAHVESLLEKYHVPGLAVAVIQGEKIESIGFGHSKVGKTPEKCDADTLFDIASASKSMTHTAVALLVDDEEKYPDVKYDAAMSSLLPDDFVMPTREATEGVAVEDILSHRTGMAPHDESYLGINSKTPDDARSVTRSLRNLPLAAPIRSKYMYANVMYTVASYLVEKTTSLDFASYLERHLFQPLHMGSSSLMPSRAREKGLSNRFATPYVWDEEQESYRAIGIQECPEAQGAGSIITSVNDYAKYVRAVVNQEGPFNQSVYAGLIRSRSFPNADYKRLRPYHTPSICTGGWEMYYYRGHMVLNHGGLVPGFGTTHFFVPGIKFGGVIFGNSEGAGIVVEILMKELIDEALEVPAAEREDWAKIEEEYEDLEDEESGDEDEETLRKQLCPEGSDDIEQALRNPTSAYTGLYSHPSYHELRVEIKDGTLFADASDRSFGFTLTFHHVCNQDTFIARLRTPFDSDDVPIKAGFKLSNGKAVSVGIHLEERIEEYIWFDRIE